MKTKTSAEYHSNAHIQSCSVQANDREQYALNRNRMEQLRDMGIWQQTIKTMVQRTQFYMQSNFFKFTISANFYFFCYNIAYVLFHFYCKNEIHSCCLCNECRMEILPLNRVQLWEMFDISSIQYSTFIMLNCLLFSCYKRHIIFC